ncbi:hypothetical protein ABPG77_002766 [Micractinium sp. CCAP 211/92]
MAPKRKSKAADLSDEEPQSGSDFNPGAADDSGSDVELEAEEEPQPKKKAAPRKRAAPKKKAAAEAEEEEDGGSGAKKKRQPAKRAKKITEITQVEGGWTLHPPSLIYKLNPKAQGGSKIAAIDLDGTLVGVKSGAQFARGPDDWKFFNKHVPEKVAELHEQGYQLWIITNQGGIKTALDGQGSKNTRARIDNVIEAINKKAKKELPFQVIMSTQTGGEYHKPKTGMWDFLVTNANQGTAPNLGESFYIGDAAGRSTDINQGADSDLKFAEGVGIKFFLPEDKFGEPELKTEAVTGTSSGLNSDMADAFRKLASILSAEPFKANAFKKVADIVDAFPEKITAASQLKGTKGVGPSSLAKVTEFLETGTLAALTEAGITVGGPPDKQAEVGLKFL